MRVEGELNFQFQDKGWGCRTDVVDLEGNNSGSGGWGGGGVRTREGGRKQRNLLRKLGEAAAIAVDDNRTRSGLLISFSVECS